jgi:uncharacterized repeat protein (TIGR03803 family)
MSRRLLGVAVLVIIAVALGSAWSTSADSQLQVQFKILYAFGAPGDGNGPLGPFAFDQKGNLYGVTLFGGANELGTVFELTPEANGQWTETILHSFPDSQDDGYQPTGIAMDSLGNLYGTTTQGGSAGNCKDLQGCGTIFELSPDTNGQWTESVIWNFCSLPNCADGGVPGYPPTSGPGGVLYGTASETAYELTPGSSGWTFNMIYTFCSLPNCDDGGDGTVGPVTLDARGDLYGETYGGGINNGGTVFTLRPQPGKQWKEFVLWNFGLASFAQGYKPDGGVALRGDGLYATTGFGGANYCVGGCGTVFELTPGSGKTVNEQVLWDFGANQAQGILPAEGVAFNSHGDLFGITIDGGSPICECGTIYGMKPQGNGQWAYQVLHTFVGTDGFVPDTTPTVDSQGNVYGTTSGGGPNGGGVVFELSPMNTASK